MQTSKFLKEIFEFSIINYQSIFNDKIFKCNARITDAMLRDVALTYKIRNVKRHYYVMSLNIHYATSTIYHYIPISLAVNSIFFYHIFDIFNIFFYLYNFFCFRNK